MLGTIAEKEIATKKLYGKMFIACVIAVSVLEVAKLL